MDTEFILAKTSERREGSFKESPRVPRMRHRRCAAQTNALIFLPPTEIIQSNSWFLNFGAPLANDRVVATCKFVANLSRLLQVTKYRARKVLFIDLHVPLPAASL